MKKFLCLLFACTLLLSLLPGSAAAFTEGEQTSPVEVDLDGDGMIETVSIVDVLEEDGEAYMGIEVRKGTKHSFAKTEIIGCEKLFLTDIDGDGSPEILFSGDWCSDDFITYCWRYKEEALVPVPFENGERLSGGIAAVSPYQLQIFTTVDALGTYTGYTDMRFEDGVIVYDADTWTIGGGEFEFTPMLLVKQDIYVLSSVGDEGEYGEEATLSAGTTIYLLETDGSTYVTFMTENGTYGVILLEDNGSGCPTFVNGMPETDVFEGIEYAD